MPAPSPLTNVQAFAHPLGQEIEVVWTLPSTLPTGWRIVVLRRAGSDITAQEITNFFAGQQFPDIVDYKFESTDFPDLLGFSDYDVTNLTRYFYQAVLQDTSDEAISAGAGGNATAKKTVTTKIVDAKAFILTAIERVMESYGMVKDEHYQLLREYSLPGMKAPVIYVTRVGGQVLNQFLGHFRQLESNLKESYGELEMDNIQVVWEDPNAVRRDHVTNIFRESKEFIREYLLHPDGGGMEFVDILIEGDVINEAVRDRTQVGGMMMISCAISSSSEISSTLASWLVGLGEPK